MDTARDGAGRLVEHANRQSCCLQLDSSRSLDQIIRDFLYRCNIMPYFYRNNVVCGAQQRYTSSIRHGAVELARFHVSRRAVGGNDEPSTRYKLRQASGGRRGDACDHGLFRKVVRVAAKP